MRFVSSASSLACIAASTISTRRSTPLNSWSFMLSPVQSHVSKPSQIYPGWPGTSTAKPAEVRRNQRHETLHVHEKGIVALDRRQALEMHVRAGLVQRVRQRELLVHGKQRI